MKLTKNVSILVVLVWCVGSACSSDSGSASGNNNGGSNSNGGSGSNENGSGKVYDKLLAECTTDADCGSSDLNCAPAYTAATVKRCWYWCNTDADCKGVTLRFPNGDLQEYGHCTNDESCNVYPGHRPACQTQPCSGSGTGTGGSGSGGSTSVANACDSCLSDCRGMSGCCEGCGCLCESECNGCF
jgi:hypothetical protein